MKFCHYWHEYHSDSFTKHCEKHSDGICSIVESNIITPFKNAYHYGICPCQNQIQKKCECGGQLVRAEGLFAVTKVQKNPDGSFTFQPNAGIPLVVLACKECGRIYAYLAKALGEI